MRNADGGLMIGTTGRPYLLFVRAGEGSRHRSWVLEDPDRSWDIAVSAWGEAPVAPQEEWRGTGGMHKWDAFTAFADEHREALSRYRYVMVADDDLEIKAGRLSRLLVEVEAAQLDLAQPALGWGSWVNHPVTAWRPFTRIRRTSFVEMMAPIFRSDVLQQLLPTFTQVRSSIGIDWIWASRLAASGRIGVVDCLAIHHVRRTDPVTGALYRMLQAAGEDPWQDYLRVQREHPLPGRIRTLHDGHVVPAWVVGPIAGPVVFACDWVIRLFHRVGVLNHLLFAVRSRLSRRRRGTA